MSESIYRTIGLHFGNVTIVVPSYWKFTDSDLTYDQAPESADIIIRPHPVSDTYTQHIQGCGKKALHMVVDTEYLKGQGDQKSEPY